MADLVGQAYVNAGIATSVVVNVPTGTVDGDVMVAVLALESDSDAGGGFIFITDPSGWTLIREDVINDGPTNSEVRLRTVIRVASSEPASYTWTATGNTTMSFLGAITTWRGVDKVRPQDVEMLFGTGVGTTAFTLEPDTATDRARVISIAVFGGHSGVIFNSGPITMIGHLVAEEGIASLTQIKPGHVTTGVWSIPQSVVWASHTIVLRSVALPSEPSYDESGQGVPGLRARTAMQPPARGAIADTGFLPDFRFALGFQPMPERIPSGPQPSPRSALIADQGQPVVFNQVVQRGPQPLPPPAVSAAQPPYRQAWYPFVLDFSFRPWPQPLPPDRPPGPQPLITIATYANEIAQLTREVLPLHLQPIPGSATAADQPPGRAAMPGGPGQFIPPVTFILRNWPQPPPPHLRSANQPLPSVALIEQQGRDSPVLQFPWPQADEQVVVAGKQPLFKVAAIAEQTAAQEVPIVQFPWPQADELDIDG